MKEKGFGLVNTCFLNRYDDETQNIAWHSDDFRRMDKDSPVCIVSFGESRSMHFRSIEKIDGERKLHKILLESGSLLVMPPGFQEKFHHKIPKGGQKMEARVSLTFRKFKNDET